MGHPMLSEHERLQMCLKSLEKPVALPEMRKPQPDTAERTRLAVQAIPFALPEKVHG